MLFERIDFVGVLGCCDDLAGPALDGVVDVAVEVRLSGCCDGVPLVDRDVFIVGAAAVFDPVLLLVEVRPVLQVRNDCLVAVLELHGGDDGEEDVLHGPARVEAEVSVVPHNHLRPGVDFELVEGDLQLAVVNILGEELGVQSKFLLAVQLETQLPVIN